MAVELLLTTTGHDEMLDVVVRGTANPALLMLSLRVKRSNLLGWG